MIDRAKSIFGNRISDRDYAKAVKGAENYRKKFGDDSKVVYTLSAEPNRAISSDMTGSPSPNASRSQI